MSISKTSRSFIKSLVAPIPLLLLLFLLLREDVSSSICRLFFLLLCLQRHLLIGMLVCTTQLPDLLTGGLVIFHRATKTGLGAIAWLGDELPVDKQPRGVVSH